MNLSSSVKSSPMASTVARNVHIPRRHAAVVFALLMSITLSGVMSLVITVVNTGFDAGLLDRWLHAYALSWSLAFPLVTILAPQVRRFVERITD